MISIRLAALILAALLQASFRSKALLLGPQGGLRRGDTAKTVKLADLIHNTQSITASDPDFAKAYLRETRQLLEVLREGDPVLWEQAHALAQEG
jgi:hypothetical protein